MPPEVQPPFHQGDYFDPPTCPDCHAILNSDGNHWASGRRECPTVTAVKCGRTYREEASAYARAGAQIVRGLDRG